MLSVTRMAEDLRNEVDKLERENKRLRALPEASLLHSHGSESRLREDNVRLAAEYKQVNEYNNEIVSENQRLKTKLNMFREAFSVAVDDCAALGVKKTPPFLVRLLDRLRPLINNA